MNAGRGAATAKVAWEEDVQGKSALFARGVVWLEGVEFSNGVIECDILGHSGPPQSNFLGVAFRGDAGEGGSCFNTKITPAD